MVSRQSGLSDLLPHDHFTHRQHRLGVMNPETKLILDELHKRFTDHDLKWDLRFEEQEKRLGR